MILAGDIGGTKTNLALFSLEGTRLVTIFFKTFQSQQFPSLETMLQQVPFEPSKITHACLGVPGAVIEGVSKAINLPWPIDVRLLSGPLGIARIRLINDLEATAYGISELGAQHLRVLASGRPREHSTAALIAAGTGLGESLLYWDGRQRVAIPTEGGLADFSPRNPLECQLLEYLRQRYQHVSWERVLSGPGLFNIYSFLKESGLGLELDAVGEQIRERDPATVISEFGLQRRCPLCTRALDLFVSLYGAESGNLALHALAFGGIYLGGGIAPKITQRLEEGGFMEAFLAKDRMAAILSSIPVYVIMEEKTALFGAARYAISGG
ncbi:MAG TPA: glucokinase [Candidatus Dormibacteraeota bacterium]|nr:glucokinase [Candidatus Dormibacteraeota bacterium]